MCLTNSSRTPMFRRRMYLPFLLVLLLAFGLAAPAMARPQADLDAPIDMELEQAELRVTLHSLASVAGARLDAPDDLEGAVTVHLESVPWRQAVDRLCRMQRLACSLSQGDEPTLYVRRSAGFAGMAAPISLSLRGADLMAVLDSFDMITGDDFSVIRDEGWDAQASIEFHALPWPLALEHLCDLSGCTLEWHDDHVVVRQRAVEWQSGAARLEELETHPQLVAFDRVEIVMHGDVVRDLTDPDAIPDLARQGSYVEALDAFCAEAGCEWRLEWGDPAVLRFWPAGSSADAARRAHQPGSARLGALPLRGLPPLSLRLTIAGPDDTPAQESRVELSWNRPRHSLGVVHAEPGAAGASGTLRGATFLHLAWIPFAPDRQVLLPLGLRCGPGVGGRHVEVFEPLALPLDPAAPWTRELAGTRLGIRAVEASPTAADEAKGGDESADLPGRRLMESLCAFPSRAVEVQLVLAESEAGDAPLRNQLLEGTVPGTYLLATPAAGRDQSVGAVALVLLGLDPDGRVRVGLVRPEGPQAREIALAPGATWSETLDSGHELRLRVVSDASAY